MYTLAPPWTPLGSLGGPQGYKGKNILIDIQDLVPPYGSEHDSTEFHNHPVADFSGGCGRGRFFVLKRFVVEHELDERERAWAKHVIRDMHSQECSSELLQI